MAVTLKALSEKLSLTFQGDAECIIKGVGSLWTAGEGELAFFDGDGVAAPALSTSKASVIIVREADASQCANNVLVSKHPRLSFAKVAELFAYQPECTSCISDRAIVSESAKIAKTACIAAGVVIGEHVTVGENVRIAPGCVVEDYAVIGDDTILQANVTLNHHVRLGARVRISSGAVVGSDGFGYTKEGEAWYKIPQVGTVIIGDDVEIGANTVIDRGAIEDTIIGKGVILDNLIQIAHNVVIGDYTAIAGCVGIAGSTTIGKHCSIGGGTGIAGHISIADKVMLTGMSMVTNSIKTPGVYSSGTGLQSNRDWHKSVVHFQKLHGLSKRVRSLEKHLAKLEEGQEGE